MKKVFNQTVRDIKREVNKKVLKLPGIEQKVLDATSNEPWGPHGSHLADIAEATRNHHEYQMIMGVIWKRINDTGKNWRHVYKALTILEYLVSHGSERVIVEIKDHAYQISSLAGFRYTDSNGRDHGAYVRRKSQSLVALVSNTAKVQEMREKAQTNMDKIHVSLSPGRPYGPGPHPSPGEYGEHYEDHQNDHRREREQGLNERNGDPHSRGKDPYVRDSDGQNGRDSIHDAYADGHNNNNYQQHELRGRRSMDEGTDRYRVDDNYHSRHSFGGSDELPHYERPRDSRISGHRAVAPPSYEDAARDTSSHFSYERNEREVEESMQAESSPSQTASASPPNSTGKSTDQSASIVVQAIGSDRELFSFDDFDPRGSTSAALHSAGSPELNSFGSLTPDSVNTLDTILAASIASSEADRMNFGPEMGFGVPAITSLVSNQCPEDPFGNNPFMAIPDDNFTVQPQKHATSSLTESSSVINGAEFQIETPKTFDDPFGGAPFKATHDGYTTQPDSFALNQSLPLSSTSQPHNSTLYSLPPSSSTTIVLHPPSDTPKLEFDGRFDFEDSLGGLPYIPTVAGSQRGPATNSSLLPTELLGVNLSMNLPPAVPGNESSAFIAPQQAQPVALTNFQPTQPTAFHHMGPSTFVSLQEVQPSTEAAKFQTPHQNISQRVELLAPTHTVTPQTNIHTYTGPTASISPHQVQPARTNGQLAHSLLPPLGFSGYPQADPVNLPSNQLMTSTHLPADPLKPFSKPAFIAPPPPKTVPSCLPPPSQSSKAKFETKSKVWADTLSRGLVDLDISGSKVNPLADIGIDLEAINRKEKRNEAKSSTITAAPLTMGVAMGAGSSFGRAGASGIAPPNPMVSSTGGMIRGGGLGLGMPVYSANMNQPVYSANMNQLMGMGHNRDMGMGMEMPRGMNMGMIQGAYLQLPMGSMPSAQSVTEARYDPTTMGLGGGFGVQPPTYGGAGYR